ncbi:HAD family hydrolase [Candidatus Riflebacteria bacterium]
MTELLIKGELFLKNPEIILVDKDGTLIDIHHYWVSMIRLRAKSIIARYFAGEKEQHDFEMDLIDTMGADFHNSRMKPSGPIGVKPRDYIVKLVTKRVKNMGVSVSTAEIEAIFRQVDEETARDLAPLLKLLPGVNTFLKCSAKYDVPIAVVTTDISSRAKQAMKTLEIGSYFVDIIGGDMVKNAKPAPELAEIILKNGDYSRAKAVVIGDHPVDIEMGLNAGINNNIGVLTGLSDREKFKAFDCSIIKDFTEIEIR